MRSRILQVKDYREVDVKPLLKPFMPDEAALEAELKRLTNPYVRWETGESVSAGDQAVCRLVSDCPRFNKENVRFVAGSGMFHKELEALAIGMAAQALLSARLGYMSEEEAERVISLYQRLGLSTNVPDYIDREQLVRKLYTDKKVRDGRLRFVLQKGIGDVMEFAPGVYAKPIEEELAREIIMEL